MQNANNAALATTKQLVSYFHDLRILLNDDKECFRKNDTNKIEENNKAKSIVLDKISNLVNQVMDVAGPNKDIGLFEILDDQATTLTHASRQEFNNLISQLKLELTECYKDISINSKVIYTTIQGVKHIWDKLLSYKSDMECVYNKNGGINK